MPIEPADLDSPALAALLAEHRAAMRATAPAESQHALGALQRLDPAHVEIKAMRTARDHQRRGVAKAILAHLLAEARAAGYARASLETGSMDYFAPARTLYAAAGFLPCGPFADYVDDPHSTYMTLAL